MLYARFNIKKDYQINNNLTLKIIRFHADGVMANANPKIILRILNGHAWI
jgi:hypothetical protein